MLCHSSSTQNTVSRQNPPAQKSTKLVFRRGTCEEKPSDETAKSGADRKPTSQRRTPASLVSTRRQRCKEASRRHCALQLGLCVKCASIFRTPVNADQDSSNSNFQICRRRCTLRSTWASAIFAKLFVPVADLANGRGVCVCVCVCVCVMFICSPAFGMQMCTIIFKRVNVLWNKKSQPLSQCLTLVVSYFENLLTVGFLSQTFLYNYLLCCGCTTSFQKLKRLPRCMHADRHCNSTNFPHQTTTQVLVLS